MRSNKPQSAVPSQRTRGFSGTKTNNYVGGPGSGATNIAAIMKKFKHENNISLAKKHEREVTHMLRNTLLEPNNSVPSWEGGTEEKKEVSATLKTLRQRYDKICQVVEAKEADLASLNKQLVKAAEDEMFISDTNTTSSSTVVQSKSELEQLQEEHKFELLTQHQYEHVLKRMKMDLIASQLRSQELQESLKSKTEIQGQEAEKLRKVKQERIQAKTKLEQILIEIGLDHRERDIRMLSLNTSVKNKELALNNKKERITRQQEIAELAASDNKDKQEITFQQSFMVQRLWSQFMKKKMEKEMNKHQYVELAFQQIRTATGFSDVNEIVTRFLTREHTYSQLLMAVSENERKIDNLRVEHEQYAARLHELQMEDDESAKMAGTQQANHLSPEIEQLDKQINVLSKTKDKADELQKKVNLVNDQVKGWSQRVIQKIDQQFGENIASYDNEMQKKTLAFMFEKIAEAVCKQLEQIMAEEEGEDQAYITAKDFMNDFATEEFLSKNIRVRPLSGVTRGEDDGRTNDYNRSMNEQAGQNDDGDAEQMRVLEMEEQRKEAKEKKKQWLIKKQIEEEKAKKKHR